jgi:hypothetical protein
MTTRKLWSIGALSAEFHLDRRTTAKRLATIPPDGMLHRHAAWFLSTAAPALLGGTVNGDDPVDDLAQRAGGPFTTTRDPVGEAIGCLLVMLAARSGRGRNHRDARRRLV